MKIDETKLNMIHELDTSLTKNLKTIDDIVDKFNRMSKPVAKDIIETAEILKHFLTLNETYSNILNKMK